VACNEDYTAMHTGGRSKQDIDAGGVLPGFAGVLVRDGYAGYEHLVDATHAWCGAHTLRDLRGLRDGDPDGQPGAKAMATTLVMALKEARAARAASRRTVSTLQPRPGRGRCDRRTDTSPHGRTICSGSHGSTFDGLL
jgi:transposase